MLVFVRVGDSVFWRGLVASYKVHQDFMYSLRSQNTLSPSQTSTIELFSPYKYKKDSL